MAENRVAELLATSERPIEDYLRVLRRKLRWRSDVADLMGEVEDHIRLAAERLIEGGRDRAAAEAIAVARFGDPDLVGRLLAIPPPDRLNRWGRLGARSAMVGAAGWLVTLSIYLAQALHDPWELTHFQIWCLAAGMTLAMTAAPLLAPLDPRLFTPALFLTGLALARQLDASTGWQWWITGTVVGLLAVGGVLRRGNRCVSLVLILAWPLAFGIQEAGKALLLGPLDSWGEPIYPPLIAYAVGAAMTAIGLSAVALDHTSVWAEYKLQVLIKRMSGVDSPLGTYRDSGLPRWR